MEYEELAAIQAAIDEAGATWRAEPNEVALLPPEEQRKLLGYTGEDDDEDPEQRVARAAERGPMAAAPEEAAAAPAAYDLRNVGGQNFVDPVQNQRSCGSCVAFGTIAAVEGTLRLTENDPDLAVDFSEAHLFYCHARGQGRTCDTGWSMRPALEVFQAEGVADEACYPYTAGDQNCTGLCGDWRSRATTITGWHAITNPQAMKEWIATRGPLVSAMLVYDDFFAYSSGVYRHVSGAGVGGHCICTVGYDDAAGCWICKNSWGPNWGEGGYFRIAYAEAGIDATKWAIDGVSRPAVDSDVWHREKAVLGLWASDRARDAAAYLEDAGWLKVANTTEQGFVTLLAQLTAAKGGNRLVSVRERSGRIVEVKVL